MDFCAEDFWAEDFWVEDFCVVGSNFYLLLLMILSLFFVTNL